MAAGVADAQADCRETGFNTTFHAEDYSFAIFEIGVAPQLPSPTGPLQGRYRVGFWYDPQDKEEFRDGSIKRDDVGFDLSLDQMVFKENAAEEDSQGLGLFARYGFAHDDVNEIDHFWSVGLQYQGLIPTRDDDVVAFGVAQGQLVEEAGFSSPHETVMELYYNASIAPWLSVSPSVQYVKNPGGDRSLKDAVVMGFRVQLTF